LDKDIDLLPFAGFVRMLFDCITGARAWRQNRWPT
jgi:hypothetical protein